MDAASFGSLSALGVLRREHDVIQRVLFVLERAAHALARGEALPPAFQVWIVDFLRTFADRCHRTKEEDVLFPALAAQHDTAMDRHVAELCREHVEFREYVRQLGEADLGEDAGRQRFIDVAETYIEKLRNHIFVEHNETFLNARRLLGPQERSQLLPAFARAEQENGTEGCYEQYAPQLEEWEERLAAP